MSEYTVKSRFGETTFESNHPSQKALYDRLKDLVSRKEIASPHATLLVTGFQRFGSWKDYHEEWAAFHVAKHDHPNRFQKGNRPRASVPGPNGFQPGNRIPGLGSILDHLVNASKTLKRPTIQLEVEDQTVVLKLNTSGNRPGTVAVSQSSRFQQGAFYGYIGLDGVFEPRNAADGTTVVQILQRVAINPSVVISEIGRQSGRCCYCPAKLTQVQSKVAGCGRTCADNYDVDYPNAARTREVLLRNPAYLVGASDADRWSQAS